MRECDLKIELKLSLNYDFGLWQILVVSFKINSTYIKLTCIIRNYIIN